MKTMQTTADYGEMLHTMDELISTYGSDFGGIDAEAQEAKNLITEMAKDVIVIPPEPTDFALMNKGKYFEEMQVPAWLNEGIQQGYKFYFMRFPLDIQAKKQSFNTVEFKMRFEDAGNKGNLFFYKFFPNDEVKKYLEGGISGKVTADANFNFKPIPENEIGNIKAGGEGAAFLKFNFDFSFGKTEVEASPQGMNYAEWEFTSRDIQKRLENFAAIIKVPEKIESAKLVLNCSGKRNTRNASWLPAVLAKWIEILHARGNEQVKTFIKNGLPYLAPAMEWTLEMKN